MQEMRRVFRMSNIGVLIYAVVNFLVLRTLWAWMAPAAAATPMGNLTFLAMYLLCACISMSFVGEWVCRFLMGARRVTRRDWAARLNPMIQEIRDRVAREYNHDLENIQVFYVYDPLPSAFAVGQRTICVSTALMDSTDEVIRAAIAQQTGRILNYDSMLSLFVTVGNVLVLGLLLIVQAIRTVVTVIGLLVTRRFFGRVLAVLAAGLTWIPVLIVTTIVQVSYLVIHLADQRKTYEADLVAVRLGYGQALIQAIEEMDVEDMADRRNLWGILNRPHPGCHERIGRIQAAMAEQRSGRTAGTGANARAAGGVGQSNDRATGRAGADAHTDSVMDWLGGGRTTRTAPRQRTNPLPSPAPTPAPVPEPAPAPARTRTFRRL